MKSVYKNSIKSLVSESMTEGKIDTAKVAKILAIIRDLPYPHNGIILKSYATRITSEIEKYTLTITTAHEVSSNFIKHVQSLFTEPIVFEEKEIDKNVIGGFRAQLGSQVIDTTIQEQIRQVEQQFI